MPTPSERPPADLGDTTLVDAWLTGLLGSEPGVALLAVGSYGRGDHAPHSDLDLVLVHDGHADIASVADRIWYPIWDAGIGLDHSVRTPRQALSVAASDLKVALGLLDGRVIAGDVAMGTAVIDGARAQWAKKARHWLPALVAAVRERHERFGEVAFLLEPDVKEGAGGLRDAAAIRAVALALPEVAAGLEAVTGGERALLDIRRALHARTGRAQDRLLLEEQDGVAAALGHISADELMASVSEAARAIAHVGEDAWRRAGTGRRLGGRWVKRIDGGLVVRDGELTAANGHDVSDPAVLLAVARAAAGHGAVLSRDLLVRFEAAMKPPGDPWPAPVREGLVALLALGHAAIASIEAIDHHGLLVRLLPEWAAVRHRPQRNALHRFTVDRHLLETAANAADGPPVDRPDLLLIGALLHDIGKGFPGDHTEAGMEVVGRVAPRMGFGESDTATLVDLVRHHLLLPDTATRRDIDDPQTASAVASSVGSVDTLRLLHALTVADSLATGPSAWSDWKAGLVSQLVQRALAVLVEGPDADAGPERLIHEADGLPPGVHGRGGRCLVVAEDRPGVLGVVAGVLAVHGLDVRDAHVGARDDGAAVEVIDIVPGRGRGPDWDAVAGDVQAALDGRFDIAAHLATRRAAYASLSARRRPTVAVEVVIDNRASAGATVIEVRAPDRLGLLHELASALGDAGADIRWARVASHGDRAIDAFYVVDAATGAKIADSARLSAIERLVRIAASG